MDDDEGLGALLLLAAATAEDEERVRRRRHALILATRVACSIRTRNYITTASLESPANSWWSKFERVATDNEFISELGLNRAAFLKVLVQ